HVAGLQVVVRSLVSGTEPVLSQDFEGDADYTAVVPTQLYRALRDGIDLSHFTAVLVGGAATTPALLAQAEAAGITVGAAYGVTERGGGGGYDGRPLPGVDVGIDADGRVRVTGPVVARGYRLEALFHNGFRTGDLGRIGPDGRLELLGRADEVIVT